MTTLIEALVVTLGLDASAFKQGSKDVDKSLKDTKDNADRTAKDLQARGKVAAEFFGQIRNQVIALAATFTAGAGLKSFVDNITTADAAVGRTARNIDMTTEALSAWQGVAERADGSAQGITGSLQGLSQQFQQLYLTGQSAVVPYFRAVGVALADANGKMRPMGDILLDLSDRFSKMDPARAQALGKGMGLDEGTINVLMHGRAALVGLLAEQEKIGRANKADAEAAAQRQKAWRELLQASANLGRQILTVLTPAINAAVSALAKLAEWLERHPVLFGTLAAAIGIAATTLTVALNDVLALRGFMGLVAAMLKVPAAAATASTATTAAAAATGGGLVKMLGFLAKSATLLTAAFAVGSAIGSAIYDAIEDTPLADRIGRWIAKGLAVIGVKGAQEALDAEQRAKLGQRYASGGISAPAAATPAHKQQAEADVQKLIGMGWTRAQAAGIAANIQRESGGNMQAVGDNGRAFGLAQWHPDRQAAFAKWAGKDIRQANRDEQLAFINYELREGSERKAGLNLMRTNDAGRAAEIMSRQYERPADAQGEAAKRAGIAISLMQPGPSVDKALQTGAAAAVASNVTNNTSTSSSHAETHIGEVNVSLPHATDAQSVAQGLGSALQKSMSMAAQANYGLS